MFKPGDIVIYLSSSNNFLLEGAEYEIKTIAYCPRCGRNFIDVGFSYPSLLLVCKCGNFYNSESFLGRIYFDVEQFRLLDKEWAEKVLNEIEATGYKNNLINKYQYRCGYDQELNFPLTILNPEHKN